ncbi:UNVERIFIED_CONTAM: hypothetical protein LK11_02170 [Mumia flava]
MSGAPDGPAVALTRARRAVVLADRVRGPELAMWLDRVADADVIVLAAHERPDWDLGRRGARYQKASRPDRIHEVLSVLGPVDAVVNLRREGGQTHRRLFEAAFFHLRHGGLYVVPRAAIDDRVDSGGQAGGFLKRVAHLSRRVGLDFSELSDLPREERELSLAVKATTISTDEVTIQKNGNHLLKVRHANATAVLRRRSESLGVDELAVLDGGAVRTGTRVVTHGPPETQGRFSVPLTYPTLHLRRYDGAIGLAPEGLVVSGDSVLPDSFRWHLSPQANNAGLYFASEHFARLRSEAAPVRHLDGAFYHLDYANPGHFGHLTTEALAKLWGWEQAKDRIPDLKLIHSRGEHHHRVPSLEQRFLDAFGVDEADVVVFDEPVTVDTLVCATPMWHNADPFYAHPGILDTWERIAAGLPASSVEAGPRIFVSRPPAAKNRACRDTQAVEDYFRDAGFSIVRPERHPLAEQASIFAGARVVAGFGGSAMFNLMYARNLERVVVLSSASYDSQNEYFYAAVRGADIHYFYGDTDVAQPDDGWSYAAYQSSWSFDLDRFRDDLDRTVAVGVSS